MDDLKFDQADYEDSPVVAAAPEPVALASNTLFIQGQPPKATAPSSSSTSSGSGAATSDRHGGQLSVEDMGSTPTNESSKYSVHPTRQPGKNSGRDAADVAQENGRYGYVDLDAATVVDSTRGHGGPYSGGAGAGTGSGAGFGAPRGRENGGSFHRGRGGQPFRGGRGRGRGRGDHGHGHDHGGYGGHGSNSFGHGSRPERRRSPSPKSRRRSPSRPRESKGVMTIQPSPAGQFSEAQSQRIDDSARGSFLGKWVDPELIESYASRPWFITVPVVRNKSRAEGGAGSGQQDQATDPGVQIATVFADHAQGLSSGGENKSAGERASLVTVVLEESGQVMHYSISVRQKIEMLTRFFVGAPTILGTPAPIDVRAQSALPDFVWEILSSFNWPFATGGPSNVLHPFMMAYDAHLKWLADQPADQKRSRAEAAFRSPHLVPNSPDEQVAHHAIFALLSTVIHDHSFGLWKQGRQDTQQFHNRSARPATREATVVDEILDIMAGGDGMKHMAKTIGAIETLKTMPVFLGRTRFQEKDTIDRIWTILCLLVPKSAGSAQYLLDETRHLIYKALEDASSAESLQTEMTRLIQAHQRTVLKSFAVPIKRVMTMEQFETQLTLWEMAGVLEELTAWVRDCGHYYNALVPDLVAVWLDNPNDHLDHAWHGLRRHVAAASDGSVPMRLFSVYSYQDCKWWPVLVTTRACAEQWVHRSGLTFAGCYTPQYNSEEAETAAVAALFGASQGKRDSQIIQDMSMAALIMQSFATNGAVTHPLATQQLAHLVVANGSKSRPSSSTTASMESIEWVLNALNGGDPEPRREIKGRDKISDRLLQAVTAAFGRAGQVYLITESGEIKTVTEMLARVADDAVKSAKTAETKTEKSEDKDGGSDRDSDGDEDMESKSTKGKKKPAPKSAKGKKKAAAKGKAGSKKRKRADSDDEDDKEDGEEPAQESKRGKTSKEAKEESKEPAAKRQKTTHDSDQEVKTEQAPVHAVQVIDQKLAVKLLMEAITSTNGPLEVGQLFLCCEHVAPTPKTADFVAAIIKALFERNEIKMGEPLAQLTHDLFEHDAAIALFMRVAERLGMFVKNGSTGLVPQYARATGTADHGETKKSQDRLIGARVEFLAPTLTTDMLSGKISCRYPIQMFREYMSAEYVRVANGMQTYQRLLSKTLAHLLLHNRERRFTGFERPADVTMWTEHSAHGTPRSAAPPPGMAPLAAWPASRAIPTTQAPPQRSKSMAPAPVTRSRSRSRSRKRSPSRSRSRSRGRSRSRSRSMSRSRSRSPRRSPRRDRDNKRKEHKRKASPERQTSGAGESKVPRQVRDKSGKLVAVLPPASTKESSKTESELRAKVEQLEAQSKQQADMLAKFADLENRVKQMTEPAAAPKKDKRDKTSKKGKDRDSMSSSEKKSRIKHLIGAGEGSGSDSESLARKKRSKSKARATKMDTDDDEEEPKKKSSKKHSGDSDEDSDSSKKARSKSSKRDKSRKDDSDEEEEPKKKPNKKPSSDDEGSDSDAKAKKPKKQAKKAAASDSDDERGSDD